MDETDPDRAVDEDGDRTGDSGIEPPLGWVPDDLVSLTFGGFDGAGREPAPLFEPLGTIEGREYAIAVGCEPHVDLEGLYDEREQLERIERRCRQWAVILFRLDVELDSESSGSFRRADTEIVRIDNSHPDVRPDWATCHRDPHYEAFYSGREKTWLDWTLVEAFQHVRTWAQEYVRRYVEMEARI
jgi:hypothetical protein